MPPPSRDPSDESGGAAVRRPEPTTAGAGRSTAAQPALEDTIAALRDEVRGLRSAAQLRAVIEQAKGVLVERHGITLDDAFDRLRAMSQEHNARLVEVAATVVGVAVPDGFELAGEVPEGVLRSRVPVSPAASRTWRDLQRQPDVRAGVVSALVDSVAGSAAQGDEAAQLLAELLSKEQVTAVAMYRLAADDSLRLVGSWGVPGDVMSSWRSIPPSRDIPYVRALEEESTYFWGDRAQRLADFPNSSTSARGVKSGFEATAVLPVEDAASVIGVIGILWTTSQVFDEQRRSGITAAVHRVAPLLMRNVTMTDPELEWLNTLLRLHLDPWLLLETVPSSDGVVRDFVVQDLAQPLAGEDWLGRRVLELWPGLAEDGLAQALAGLVQSGGSWTMTVGVPSEAPWGIPGSRVRAVRLGRRIVLVWRPSRNAERWSAGRGQAHHDEGGVPFHA